MKHAKKIIVNCWKCKKPFDLITAKKCLEHLNLSFEGHSYTLGKMGYAWTTKCSHCGACICHKYNKMQDIKCNVLNKVGIMRVMPSVKRQLEIQ